MHQLGRDQSDIEGHAGLDRRLRIGEDHGEARTCRSGFTPATAGAETAEPSERLGQDQRSRDRVAQAM